MSPKHSGGRRARVVWHDTAVKQVTAMSPDDRVRLDRLLVAITRDPTIGQPDASGLLRDYRADECRIVYFATALGSVIVVAYAEA